MTLLQPELNQEGLLRRITNRIRQSLELQEILTATVAEILSLLGTDRVVVYRFHESGSGEVIAEAIQDNRLPSLIGLNFPADDIPEEVRQSYLKTRLRSIVDVSSGLIGLSPVDASGSDEPSALGEIYYRPVDPCHAAYLTAMGVQCSMVLPIIHYDVHATHTDTVSVKRSQVKSESYSVSSVASQEVGEAASQERSFANLRTSERLWGLLVSHHAEPRSISKQELQIVQLVVDQVSIAIAQSTLLSQTRQQHVIEATINRVSTLLHSLPTIQLQAALEETVAALQGSGGRLYIAPYKKDDSEAGRDSILAAELFTCGTQPIPPDGKKQSLIEQHPVFSTWALFKQGENINPQSGIERESGQVREWENSPTQPPNKLALPSSPDYVLSGYYPSSPSPPLPLSPNSEPLFTTDLYKTPNLRVLTPAFKSTPIRGMLVLPLYYRSSFLGYLSIFRSEVDTEILWAGRFDPSEKQRLPRQSFEVWRELKRGQSQEWTSKDIELAIAFGHHFAMAIEQYKLYSLVHSLNTNLESQVEERTAKLQQSLELGRAFERVTNQIRSTLDLKTTLHIIVREVRSLLDTDRVVIYQFTDSSQGEVIIECINGNWLSISGVSDPLGYFLDTQIQLYNRGRVRVINDVSKANLTPDHREFLTYFQIRSFLIVPIGVGAQVWGLLIAQECKAPRGWLSSEIDLLQQLADQAAVAIQQAELYEQSCKAAATATAQAQHISTVAKQQQALFGVITKIRESLDVNTIFKATTTEVRRLLGTERVAVFRFAPNSGYDDGEFISEDVQPGFTSVIGSKIRDHCFGEQYAEKYHQGRIQAIADIYNASLSYCHIKILAQFRIRANLVVPLLKGEVLWGLLCIHQCTGPRPWNTSEIDFASQIAAHLGVALQQAELLAQTQQQAEQLASTLDNLKQTQTQLIQTEKMSSLGQLVAGVAHEINNPVNFISGNLSYTSQYAEDLLTLLNLYQKHYPNPKREIVELAESIDLDFLNEDLPKILGSMKIGTDRIRKLVLSLRNFSRLDQAEMKPVDIHEGLDSTLLILQHRLKVKPNQPGIKVARTYGKLPLVECYASQLNQVFMNVLSNAIDALEDYNALRSLEEIQSSPSEITIRTSVKEISTQETGRVREWEQGRGGEVSVQLGRNASLPSSLYGNTSDEHVVIQIADNGPGMSQAIQSQIFNPFFTTKPIGKGTGLGLSISYQIVVEKHGGTFKCFSQPGQGTEFWIEIPIRQLKSVGVQERECRFN
ncbi:MAG TPA: GAF domain-containing protein [Coleofasciculaceae cyanobacterium]